MNRNQFATWVFSLTLVFTGISCTQKVDWVSTTESKPWVKNEGLVLSASKDSADVRIDPNQTAQTIEGFGACFNELGWTSLSRLSVDNQHQIFSELI